jgi:hypothetical protein
MMNPFERLQKRLHAEAADRPPKLVILMTLAAQHIGQPLSNYYLDYRVLVAATRVVREDFELDIVQVISDPHREAADFGLQMEFPEDNLPVSRKPIILGPADIHELVIPNPATGRLRDPGWDTCSKHACPGKGINRDRIYSGKAIILGVELQNAPHRPTVLSRCQRPGGG